MPVNGDGRWKFSKLVSGSLQQTMEDYTPISGKTYSLFGENSTTQPFYRTIRAHKDEMLEWYPVNDMEILEYINKEKRDIR